MSMAAKVRRAPGRVAAGAFILNSGLSKFAADEEHAKALHGMACNSYPIFNKLDPKTFTRALAVTELALGGALLLPVVPAGIAGAGLAAFSGGLLGLYWQTPGMHQEGDPRPTQQGTALAKDVWMAGIGAGLLADALVPEVAARRAVRRARKRADKAEAKLEADGDGLGLLAQADVARRIAALPGPSIEAARGKARALQSAAVPAAHSALDAARSASAKAQRILT